MTTFIITACYNYLGKLDKYVESFNKSFDKYKDSINNDFFFVFVSDQPKVEDKLPEIVSNLRNDHRISYTIFNNKFNIGATRSRNRAARFITREFDSGRIIYFDADDIWTEDAVKILDEDISDDTELIFHPVNVSTIPINKECSGLMSLSKFCTYVPLQECIYSWKLSWAKEFIDKHGFLWYEDESDSKYFPEDMMFLINPHQTALVTDKVICNRNYETGNIAHNWEETIIKNKSAFKVLIQLHKSNMKLIEYPNELLDYISYLEYLTK